MRFYSQLDFERI
ncbi:BnaAnng27270D [Brassica napus]|nr:BnaAnng27270D [Brassica napus]